MGAATDPGGLKCLFGLNSATMEGKPAADTVLMKDCDISTSGTPGDDSPTPYPHISELDTGTALRLGHAGCVNGPSAPFSSHCCHSRPPYMAATLACTQTSLCRLPFPHTLPWTETHPSVINEIICFQVIVNWSSQVQNVSLGFKGLLFLLKAKGMFRSLPSRTCSESERDASNLCGESVVSAGSGPPKSSNSSKENPSCAPGSSATSSVTGRRGFW